MIHTCAVKWSSLGGSQPSCDNSLALRIDVWDYRPGPFFGRRRAFGIVQDPVGRFPALSELPCLPGAIGSQFCSGKEPWHLVNQEADGVVHVPLPADLHGRDG